MDVALIAPDSMLEWTTQGHIHFILSGALKNHETRLFFAKESKYKMMDNGVYELGAPSPVDEILQLAREVGANEVVAPDWFHEKEATFNATKEFLETTNERRDFKVCVVPQAKDPLEFIEAYEQMSKLEGIDVMALPIWLQKLFKSRPAVAGYLRRHGLWNYDREHHLLGLDGYGELYAYERHTIRSVDTSLPFSLTNANSWTPQFGDSAISRVDMRRPKFHKAQEALLQRHINLLKGAASYV